MNLIQQITDEPHQKQGVILDDGSVVKITLSFRPMQYGWFIDELTHGDFTLRGVRLCVSPNLLHQFRNQLPFGLFCTAKGNREPSLQEDFASGNASLYVLSAAEVEEYTEFLNE